MYISYFYSAASKYQRKYNTVWPTQCYCQYGSLFFEVITHAVNVIFPRI